MKKETVDMLANVLAYNLQDFLDDLSSGGKFNFSEKEKEFKKIIKSCLEEEKEN